MSRNPLYFEKNQKLKNMLLILLTHHTCGSANDPPNENYMKIEKLVDDLKLFKNYYYNSKICFAQLNINQNYT